MILIDMAIVLFSHLIIVILIILLRYRANIARGRGREPIKHEAYPLNSIHFLVNRFWLLVLGR